MTEKRFTFTQDTLAKADVFDGDEFVCCTLSVWVEQLVDLLNQINNENEQLKSDIWYWGQSAEVRKKEIDRLRKEKGKLEVELECLSDELRQCKAVIDKRWNEYLEKKGDDVND